MKAQIIKREQFLRTDIKRAWDFFSSPLNLADITPEWLGFSVMTDVPEKMYEGLMVQYTVRPFFSLPVWWVTEITHVKEPYFFVDEQRKGPYALWHHEHHFREADGGVHMTDVVNYILPVSFFSQPLAGGMVWKKVEAIFDHRYRVLDGMFNK